MPNLWKTVRVFISSTFRDMHAERDHLVKVVFPALRERLQKHRVYLDDIDLRWGLTREDTINQKTLLLCLDSIHESRPFFLGILGDVYGSRATAFTAETLAEHPWVNDAVGKSYTELEILYRLFQLKGLTDRAFFCFRSPKVYKSISEPRSSTFIEADSQSRETQEALKQTIREHFPATQRKHHLYDGYPARWDPDTFDRPSNSLGRIGGLEAFGKWVLKRLWEAIKAEHNLPDVPASETTIDPLAVELDYHERFIESRLRVYVPRKDIHNQLWTFVNGDAVVPCLVTGPSGSGKSAVLAHFFTESVAKHESEIESKKLLAIPHFVGASPRSTNLRDVLRRFCLVLKARFGFAEEVPEETAKLSVTFREFIAKFPRIRGSSW